MGTNIKNKKDEKEGMDESKLIRKIKAILIKDYGYPKKLIQTEFSAKERKAFNQNFACEPVLMIWTPNQKNRLISITTDYKNFNFTENFDPYFSPMICVYNGKEFEVWYKQEILDDIPSFDMVKDLTIKKILKLLDDKMANSGFFDITNLLKLILVNFRNDFDASEYQVTLASVLLAKAIDEIEFKGKYFEGQSQKSQDRNFLSKIFSKSKIAHEFLELTNPKESFIDLQKIIPELSKHSILKSDIPSIENFFINLSKSTRGKGIGMMNQNVMVFIDKYLEIEKDKKILLYWQNDLTAFFSVLEKIRRFYGNNQQRVKEFIDSSLVITTTNHNMLDLFRFFGLLNNFKLNVKVVDEHSVLDEYDFDFIILTSPTKYRGRDIEGPYGKYASNYLILSCLDTLKPNGKAAFISFPSFFV